MAELRGLGAVHDELVRRGGTLLAISVDPPERSREKVVERNKLPFAVLADVDRIVTRAYGVLHEKGAPDGSDVALPAQFLIDRNGNIVWQHIAAKIPDRPAAGEILQHIRALP